MSIIFELKEEHFKLLNHCYVQWNACEFGAPEIDPKRPYGNSGMQIYYDMMDILGIEKEEDYSGEIIITKEVGDYLEKIHRELDIALQIILITGKFQPGFYKKSDKYCDRSWELVE